MTVPTLQSELQTAFSGQQAAASFPCNLGFTYLAGMKRRKR
jgi:hypothetical protein